MGTRVFISWSGDKSRAVATALRDWLPNVIQAIDPFMSAVDIAAGSRPMSDIESSLAQAEFGIICVTADNWEKPWLNFEAGAISKRLGLEDTKVSPLLIDLKPEDIDSPLKQFQMKKLDRDGLREVLESINMLCGDGALSSTALATTFDMWWPRLEQEIRDASEVSPARAVKRGQEAKIDELLNLVRGLSVNLPHLLASRDESPMRISPEERFLRTRAEVRRALARYAPDITVTRVESGRDGVAVVWTDSPLADGVVERLRTGPRPIRRVVFRVEPGGGTESDLEHAELA